MKKLQAKLLVRKPEGDNSESPEVDDVREAGNDYDEEEVKRELEARMSVTASRGEKNRRAENLVVLDISNLENECFRISDFPAGMEPGKSGLWVQLNEFDKWVLSNIVLYIW